MIDPSPFYTLSAVLVFGALLSLVNRWVTLGGLFLTIAGAGGLGIFLERWSLRTGHYSQVAAMLNPVTPTRPQFELLISHAVMLILGITILSAAGWKRSRTRNLEPGSRGYVDGAAVELRDGRREHAPDAGARESQAASAELSSS